MVPGQFETTKLISKALHEFLWIPCCDSFKAEACSIINDNITNFGFKYVKT